MYFISRTNKIYHFLAHIRPVRRYVYTSMLIFICCVIWFCAIKYPLLWYERTYEAELKVLHKTFEDDVSLTSKNKNTIAAAQSIKNGIQSYCISDKQEDYFKSESLWLLDLIDRLKMRLKSYSVINDRDSGWYKKEMTQVVVDCTFEQILSLCEAIKNSQKMLRMSHVSLHRIDDDTFQYSFTISSFLIYSI